MTTGEEKTVLTLKSIILYTLVKKVFLGMFCLMVYLDPTWFPNGITGLTLLLIVGVDLGIDILFTVIKFGIIGIHQVTRVKK